MAEFCLECLNKYIMPENEQLTEEEVTMDLDLCDCCGQWKECVISIKREFGKRLRKKTKN